ncbi:hypothetical protein SPBR_03750 [Sporothrix brasiliensis 5110]|uniref:Vacuolar sorting protein Vps3844 C-terminal domain-containing protein n=1 Tax=Sporothrix brasiliensis 5110 TaxID=1398154 RepID=A0A0C2FUZ0_9PEZI|nr:uncharacterized protein SPBR_03750 [Sporothrix brasiliensis 5110]KIH94853.1 hypothetical protein SPBR_03750 [Sporothrix brasiliensis 5110]
MKLLAGLAVAACLASSAAAAAVPAPVYLLRSSPSSSSPSSSSTSPNLPRQIARQVLLRRLGASDGSSFYDSLPRDVDPETALGLIEQFGSKAKPALFAEDASSAAAASCEMLVVVQGAQPEHVAALEAALPSAFAKPAFTVADPPSEAANTRLFVDELASAGIAAHTATSVADAVAAPASWAHGIFVGLYDAKKDATTVDALVATLPDIVTLVESGAADVALLLLPESSRYAQWKQWASSKGLQPANARLLPPKARPAASELRIRGASSEFVMEEEKEDKEEKEEGKGVKFVAAAAPLAPIPGCFQSFNACVAQTNSCSEHGKCIDKYAANNGGVSSKSPAGSCFVCHCFKTLNRPADSPGGLSTTQWAGNMCQKQDVSVPFWLLTGFTVTIVGAVSFAIGLLFSVGEEKLPGVIGAGVSRAK